MCFPRPSGVRALALCVVIPPVSAAGMHASFDIFAFLNTAHDGHNDDTTHLVYLPYHKRWAQALLSVVVSNVRVLVRQVNELHDAG